MSTIEEENKLIKRNTVNYLSNIKNLYLSYCLSTPFKEHNKQIILSNVNYLNVVNDNKHSDSLNKNKYNEKLDNLNNKQSYIDNRNSLNYMIKTLFLNQYQIAYSYYHMN